MMSGIERERERERERETEYTAHHPSGKSVKLD